MIAIVGVFLLIRNLKPAIYMYVCIKTTTLSIVHRLQTSFSLRSPFQQLIDDSSENWQFYEPLKLSEMACKLPQAIISDTEQIKLIIHN